MRVNFLIIVLTLLSIPQLALATPDPLTKLNIQATTGAAAGYVPDLACSTCHMNLYQSYQSVGMARSFTLPANAKPIEKFGEEFYHAASERYYRIDKHDDKLTFYRYQKDLNGKPINTFTTPIDWVLGSGNRARSYLYRTELGELFMLPLGWYSQTNEWGMSPGFENKTHYGVQRQVRRECLFCHNAFPEVAVASDNHLAPHLFPLELPQGTGCQRCHGPGADHIRAALNVRPSQEIQAKIINPRRLPAEERDSVCFQCHMLPAVSIVGARKFDRSDYSFRPGQKLSEYLVHVETTEADTRSEDKFEINHHGYRFWQSQCYQKSAGQLACISCHDPHIKPESMSFRKTVSAKCLNCHQQASQLHKQAIDTEGDCVTCHMPTRRTQDVIKVTMTDHRIAKGPFDLKELQRERHRTEPVITELNILPWGTPPKNDEAKIYRATATLRSLTTQDATSALKNLLIKNQLPLLVPYVDLLNSELKLHRYEGAENTVSYLLRQGIKDPAVLTRLGIMQLGQGKLKEAISTLEGSLSIEATPETYYNLGLAAFRLDDRPKALASIEAAIAMRPNMHSAWFYKGQLLTLMHQPLDAIAAFKRSLQISPNYTKAYESLIPLLRETGQFAEATRYLDIGLRSADQPQSLRLLAPTPETSATKIEQQ